MNNLFYDFEIYRSPDTNIPPEYLRGDNEKKLLIVIKNEDDSEENISLLTKILYAVKLNLKQDVLLLSNPKEKIFGINKMMQNGVVNKILIFGINPKEMGLSISTQMYQVFTISAQQVLIAHPIDQIRQKQDLKKALWSALQKFFPQN